MNKKTDNSGDSFRKVSSYYDGTYYRHAVADAPAPSLHTRRLAKRFVRPGMNVLDVACGLGEFLVAANQCGARVFGIDISQTAIDICKQRMPAGEFHTGVAEELPFPDNTMDLVFCLGSLEHFLEQKQALEEMLRVARPEAIFIILVPNADFLTRKLGLFKGTDQVNVKEDVKTLEKWQELFDSAGLQVTECWKDLHVLSYDWIYMHGWKKAPLRLLQAMCLVIWPLRWQYQIYFMCKRKAG